MTPYSFEIHTACTDSSKILSDFKVVLERSQRLYSGVHDKNIKLIGGRCLLKPFYFSCVTAFTQIMAIWTQGVSIPSLVANGLTVAELERHKTNMNTKEKHIIQSILNRDPIRVCHKQECEIVSQSTCALFMD